MRLYEGLRVVEFTTNIAGPTIGRWLAEYGADVIHVERPVYGDDSRGYPPMFDGVSAQYHTLNHGKKSLVLDLKDPEGLKIAKELCKTADIWKATGPAQWTDWGWAMKPCGRLTPG